jgi:hypothetical protein
MAKERILRGMRPSGKLHLGNYLGTLKNWVQLQADYECFYFVADWHALTTGYADTVQTRTWVREIAIDYLSAGLDPERSVLFIQSRGLEHAVFPEPQPQLTAVPKLPGLDGCKMSFPRGKFAATGSGSPSGGGCSSRCGIRRRGSGGAGVYRGQGLGAGKEADNLNTLCIVSKVTVATGEPSASAFSEAIPGLALVVHWVPGEKGERCWRYQEDVGSVAAHHTVYGRCGTYLQDT